MASGHLLLGRDESLREVVTKRIVRILIPLAFWTAVFVVWRFAYRENFNPSMPSTRWRCRLLTIICGFFTP